MQGLTGVVKKIDISESTQDVVIIAEAEYREDELNYVITHTLYRICSDGTLHVDLKVVPCLDVPELPEIGIELELLKGTKTLSWLGEGPIDSLPGKSSATYFGWWQADPESPMAKGTKSDIEWAQIIYENKSGLHIKDCAGVRLETEGKQTLRILTHLAVPWSKNGPAERDEWHLELSEKRTFKESFEIIPINLHAASI